MEWWIAAIVLVLIVAVVLSLLPVRIALNLQGRGERGGVWAVAGGAQTGPLALSGVAATGIESRVLVHVFGRQVYARTGAELLAKKEEADEEERGSLQRIQDSLAQSKRGYDRFQRWLDPADLLLHVVHERRRIQLSSLEMDLEYSFEDVLLTGKLLGAIYALGGVLPPRIAIRQTASWESIDRFNVGANAEIRVWPGLLLVDTVVFVVRNLKLRRPRAARGARQAS